MSISPQDLELRKFRLEKNKAFLSVLTPILVFAFGVVINAKLETQKEAIQQLQIHGSSRSI